MADPRFFSAPASLTLAQIVELTGATLVDQGQASIEIVGIGSLDRASGNEISFWSDAKHKESFAGTKAGACFVRPDADVSGTTTIVLTADDPQLAYARVAQAFYPDEAPEGISPKSYVSEGAELGRDCSVSEFAVIREGAQIGDEARIGANAVIGKGVTVGRRSTIGDNVTLSHCLIGDDVRIHNGARIGQDGFGYAPSLEGHIKIPQIGRVIIQNKVEIGAGTCIDRGALDDTVIGEGTKIDNLVQIGHNCRIGRHCIIVAHCGLSGSVELDDFAVLGGAVGVADHVKIGKGSQVAARSGVHRDVPDGEIHGGYPAQPIADWRREFGLLRRMVRQSRKPDKS